MLKLTDQGRKEVSNFAGTVEKYAVQKGSVNGVYEESWHVADNYCLRIILYVNKDFIEL